jgi:hypothetical protein
MYCMFFERYGDVVVPVLITVQLLAYSSPTDFDCRLKTANEKFILDFVMVNIFTYTSVGQVNHTTELCTRVYDFVPRLRI